MPCRHGLRQQTARHRESRRALREWNDDQKRAPVTDPSCRQQYANGAVGIIPKIVQEARKQDEADVTQHTHEKGDKGAKRKIPVEQEAWIEKRMLRGKAMHDEDPVSKS